MLEKDDIKKLFLILQARYGHKWTTAYDDPEMLTVAVNEWHRELKGFRAEDIRTGLDIWNDGWPPSLPEFAECCLPDLEELGFNVEQEVRERLPSYKYLARDAHEEHQRMKKEQEIRQDVIAELLVVARGVIKEQGVQTMLTSEKRLLS